MARKKAPKTPRPERCTIVDDPSEAPCELARIGSLGPGYLPGRAGFHGGRLYCTPDFPMADAARMLRYHRGN